MRRITLTRLESSDQGTFGLVQFTDGGFLESFYAGELNWLDNRSNVSCIPIGLYRCTWTFSPHFKRYLYLVEGVKNRAGIRIHPANFMGDDTKGFKRQLNGCIALGERLGQMDGQKALLLSAPAMRRFEATLNGEPFELEVK